MRVLITGIAGFVGSHLAEFLLNETNVEVHGTIHRHDQRVQHLRSRLHLYRGDLRNALWISDVIQRVRPDMVVHLAAWSDVGGSWQQPWATYELNVQCQLHLLEALCQIKPDCQTLIVSSNEVYGLVQPEDLPIDEAVPFRPHTPYGVSKLAQDMMGQQYWLSHHLPVIRARSFNHIGPGQSADFAASAFARQIAEIEAGQSAPVVRVGNLEAERDFTDVRDVVRAYWLALTLGEPGAVYNVGSGTSHRVRWLLDTLIDLTSHEITIETDPARLRPSDIPISVCDNRKLAAQTGWQLQYDLRTTLHDVLTYWRGEV